MSKGALPAEEVSERAGQPVVVKSIIGRREYLEIVVDALNNESSDTLKTSLRRSRSSAKGILSTWGEFEGGTASHPASHLPWLKLKLE